jgi:hypothetical protein
MADGGGAETGGSNTAPVFISYASPDAAIAEKICAALEAAGLFVLKLPPDLEYFLSANSVSIQAADRSSKFSPPYSSPCAVTTAARPIVTQLVPAIPPPVGHTVGCPLLRQASPRSAGGCA